MNFVERYSEQQEEKKETIAEKQQHVVQIDLSFERQIIRAELGANEYLTFFTDTIKQKLQ